MSTTTPFQLEGTMVRLRDFRLDDVDDAADIVGDDRVTHHLSFDSRDRAQTEQMISRAIESAHVDPRTEYYLAVTPLDADRVIGFARLALTGVRAAKLGCAVHADHWNKGFATDAARTLINHGFAVLQLHRITAAVGPDNHVSQSGLRRLGFTLEGRLRDHVHTNGAWRDSLLYSLLATEWPNNVELSNRD